MTSPTRSEDAGSAYNLKRGKSADEAVAAELTRVAERQAKVKAIAETGA